MNPAAACGAIARGRGGPVTRARFMADATALCRELPDSRFAVNLCEDRYRFAVGFAAALMRGQTNLLPPSRLPGVCDEIAGRYPNSYCLVDARNDKLSSPQAVFGVSGTSSSRGARELELDATLLASPEHLAAVAFTSGSTGTPHANPKPWGALVQGARLAQAQFSLDAHPGYTIVATVPPQHMYGLETSIMLPLVCGGSFMAASVLFPEDIRRALAQAPAPRVLVTTPLHLRTLVQSGLPWPEVAVVISATAPLSPELAKDAERVLRTEVHEIFGFSEAGSVASRRTTQGDWWRPYAGVALARAGDEVRVAGGHVPFPVAMNDHVEIAGDGRFKLLGRKSDIVNVAGKRASLAELNAKLTRIEGVEDGVFVPPELSAREQAAGELARLGALVVAPALTAREINDRLAEALDPVFMPRPLRKVSALPRNETGKLPRAQLVALLHRRDEDESAPHAGATAPTARQGESPT